MGFAALAPGGPIPGPAPHCRRGGTIIVVLAGTPLLVANALRFRSDPPAGPERRGGQHLPRVEHASRSSGSARSTSSRRRSTRSTEIAQRARRPPRGCGRRGRSTTWCRATRSGSSPRSRGRPPRSARCSILRRPARRRPMRRPSRAIRAAAGSERSPPPERVAAAAATRLLPASSTELANADAAMRGKARDALVAPLRLDLDRLAQHAAAGARSPRRSVPPELARDWVAPDGRARIEVLPKGDPNDTATLRRFAPAVLAVAPDAAGTPVVAHRGGAHGGPGLHRGGRLGGSRDRRDAVDRLAAASATCC